MYVLFYIVGFDVQVALFLDIVFSLSFLSPSCQRTTLPKKGLNPSVLTRCCSYIFFPVFIQHFPQGPRLHLIASLMAGLAAALASNPVRRICLYGHDGDVSFNHDD